MELLTKQEHQQILDSYLGSIIKEIQDIKAHLKKIHNPEELITRADVAKKLGISYHHVMGISYNRETEQPSKRKVLPCINVGGNLMYRLSEVIEYETKIKG